MLVSFAPSLAGLDEEMRLAAQAADQNISVFSAHAAGALEALQSGDSEGPTAWLPKRRAGFQTSTLSYWASFPWPERRRRSLVQPVARS